MEKYPLSSFQVFEAQLEEWSQGKRAFPCVPCNHSAEKLAELIKSYRVIMLCNEAMTEEYRGAQAVLADKKIEEIQGKEKF